MIQHIRHDHALPHPHQILLCIILLALVTGCAAPQRPAQTVTETPLTPGYEGLQEEIKGRDLSPLHRRRILIDPGHGGHFRGAIGPNGLTEAEVNLGVALNLRGLLEWAGAEVWLTRTSDSDFLSPADSLLSTDIAFRVSLSDSLQPDVFISIHHNSTASLDRTINETQTYYPLNDDGASLDLARSIHRHLVINLEIQPASIRPGNFHVLRNATVPAILGEPAMISHPVMAERLSLAASQRLEAQAYFLGLLDYFKDGLPTWAGAATDTVWWGQPEDPTIITWRFRPEGTTTDSTSSQAKQLPGPDPSHFRLTLDGKPTAFDLSPDGREVTWQLPHTLSPTVHTLELRGRNLAGRATPRRRTVLRPRNATSLAVEIIIGQDSSPTGIQWHGLAGAPLPKGQLQLGPDLSFAVGPAEPNWVLSRDVGASPESLPVIFTSRDNPNPSLPCLTTIRHLSAGQQLHLVTHHGRPFAPRAGWRGRLNSTGQSPLIITNNNSPLWLEGAGIQPLIDADPTDPAAARTVAGAADHWEVVPILAGLAQKIIVLDPAGGGTITDGSGPLGLRGADLNLAVAQHTAKLLRGAGAEVHLTRHDETVLLPVEKVRLAGQVGADLFLTIGRHPTTASRVAQHHPGSIVGSRWAAAMAQASALLPTANDSLAAPCRTMAASSYLLRHTAAPALQWQGDLPTTASSELRQGQPGWQQAEARAIFLAIVSISGHPGVFAQIIQPTEALQIIANAGGLPATMVDWAWLDGNLPWTPLPPLEPMKSAPVAPRSDTLDSITGPGLPALLPRLVIEIHAGAQWQVWLLEREKTTWQPTLLLGSPEPADHE